MLKKFLFKKIFNKYAQIAASVNLKPRELDLSEKKCLCLVPHPDDESIGMGGVLSLFNEYFEIVLLTDGRKGIKDKASDEVIQIRYDEFKKALSIAKIEKVSFLGIEDKKLLSATKEFQKLSLGEYDYIFIPNIIDQHPDHKAVSLLLNDLIKSGIEIKKDLKICFYEVWSALGLVSSFVDITDVIENKKAMIKCYQSQVAQKDYVHHSTGLNQYRGMFKDKKYAEAFFVMDIDEFAKICEIYS